MTLETQSQSPARPGLGRATTLLLALVVALFAALRFAALFNDLWMDEIWSIKLVGAFQSPLEIFTHYFQANNHPLSSLWLYVLVPAQAEWTYRLLSWFTGSASVLLAALIVVRQFWQNRPEASVAQLRVAALTTATLVGTCYFLILYSSEARGYAPALAFCLAAFYALQRSPDAEVNAWIILYWVSGALALLSHAASVQVIGAAFVWSFVRLLQAGLVRRRILHLLLWHGVPWACSAAFYWFFLRRVEVGGAPELSFRQVIGELVAYTVGLPSPEVGWMTLPLLALVTLFALWRMWRRDRADSLFYTIIIFSAPVTGLVAAPFAALFPRYFIFGAAWLLVLAGWAIASAWHRGPAFRKLGLAVLVFFVLGNSVHTLRLLLHGRGQYQAALRYIAEHTTAPDITICSDHDNRNFMLIDHYAARNAGGRRVIYYPGNRTHHTRPEWLLVHRLDGLAAPDTTLFDDRGNEFKFEQRFLHAPLSGWDWFVYHNRRFGQP